jgi:hypothetical protein
MGQSLVRVPRDSMAGQVGQLGHAGQVGRLGQMGRGEAFNPRARNAGPAGSCKIYKRPLKRFAENVVTRIAKGRPP